MVVDEACLFAPPGVGGCKRNGALQPDVRTDCGAQTCAQTRRIAGESRSIALGKLEAKEIECMIAYPTRRILVPVAEGSNPSSHPKSFNGQS
jgi:hypothetical protein